MNVFFFFFSPSFYGGIQIPDIMHNRFVKLFILLSLLQMYSVLKGALFSTPCLLQSALK